MKSAPTLLKIKLIFEIFSIKNSISEIVFFLTCLQSFNGRFFFNQRCKTRCFSSITFTHTWTFLPLVLKHIYAFNQCCFYFVLFYLIQLICFTILWMLVLDNLSFNKFTFSFAFLEFFYKYSRAQNVGLAFEKLVFCAKF